MSAKFEKEIFKEINNFRQNPKSIQHQIEVLGKGISRLRPNDPFLKEIDEFIRTIDRIPKMPPVVLNPTLNQVAKDEAKKYSRNESTYNPYLIGNQLKGILPEGFLSQNPGLIADSGADEAQTIVPKLLLEKIIMLLFLLKMMLQRLKQRLKFKLKPNQRFNLNLRFYLNQNKLKENLNYQILI